MGLWHRVKSPAVPVAVAGACRPASEHEHAPLAWSSNTIVEGKNSLNRADGIVERGIRQEHL